MKRYSILIAVVCVTLLTFSSCTKEYITNYLPSFGYVYSIRSNQWIQAEPRVYRFEQSIPEFDARYFENGAVSVAISFDNNQNSYDIIPATFGNYVYTVNYSVGVVRIFAEYRGAGTSTPPDNMHTKIILTDAEVGN
jgi:hypothetical protein